MEVKIKLKVKDTEIEVSQQDLKELYTFLETLFGVKKVEYVQAPWVRPFWYYSPYWCTGTSIDNNTDGSWGTNSGVLNVSYSAVGTSNE